MPMIPSTLPLPQAEGNEIVFHIGRSMTTFDSGHTRQRFTHSKSRSVISLSYVFTTAQLAQWQAWTNKYGFDWFDNYRPPSLVIGNWLPAIMRYTSDIRIEALSQRHFRVTVMAEIP